jgi:hypothetical protein
MSDWLEEIRRLYFNATAATIQRDLARAVAILKSLPSDDERQRAAVYMEGLAEMRKEWADRKGPRKGRKR